MKTNLTILLLFLAFGSFGQNLTAQFSASPLEICLGEQISFTDLSIAGASPIQTWNWDFGDGNASNSQNPIHTYTNAGTFNVTLTVQAQDGSSDVEVKPAYIIVNPLPVIDFTLNNSLCSVPVVADFANNSSNGAEFTYAWNFGNGQTSTDYNPSGINYSSEGSYDVVLTITNTTTGCINSDTTTYDIYNYEADINLSVDSLCQGELLQINDASTTGTNQWNWNFDNGGAATTQNNSSVYINPGSYTITLIASNTNIGCTDTAYADVEVMPIPTVNFTADPTYGCDPLTVDFTNNSTGGTTYNWDFGDGSTYTGTTPPPHQYNGTGLYSVNLQAITDFGCSNSLYVHQMIDVDPLIAGIYANPRKGCEPLTVQFYDTCQIPNASQNPIIDWEWDFGNGNTYNGEVPPPQTYNLGTYDVQLIVTTSTGCVDTVVYSDYVEVGIVDSSWFSYTPMQACANEPIQFSGNHLISVPYDSIDVIYNWSFGDGGSSVGQTVDYAYTSDTGYFDVTLTVDWRGCTHSTTINDAVYIDAPVSNFQVNYGGLPSSTVICNPPGVPLNLYFEDIALHGVLSDDVDMTWNWGDGSSDYLDDPDLDDADLGSMSHTFNDYGDYEVQQIIQNHTTGCTDSLTRTIVISYIEAELGFTNDSLCFGDPFLFADSSSSSHNIFPIDPWTTLDLGDGTIEDGWYNSHLYPSPGTYPVAISVVNEVGCTDTDTVDIVALTPPTVSFSPDPNAGCAPLNVSFINNSSATGNGVPLEFFHWTIEGSNQTTGVGQPINHVYTSEGSFPVIMYVEDEFGCVSPSLTSYVDVTKPTADFTVDSAVCNNETFVTANLSTGSQPLSYDWFIDNNYEDSTLTINGQFNEVTSPSYNSVAHQIALVTTDANGCTDTLTQPVVVSLPHADAGYAFSGATINAQGEFVCPPVFASLSDSSNSYGALTNWDWTFGNGNTSTLQNPQNTYVYAGTYTASLTITDEFGCTDDTTFLDYVTINGPSGDPNWVNIGDICDPQFEFQVNNAVGVTHAYWDFGNGEILDNISPFTYVYDTNGNYNPTVIIADDFGCEIPYILDPISVTVNDLNAYFTASMFEGEVSEVFTFTDGSTSTLLPIETWTWNFGEGTITNYYPDDVDFDWNYTGYHDVLLTVADSNGCSDSYTLQVLITAEFFVPNVFTPDGDQINDYFKLDFDVFNGYEYTIVNRWGNVVARETDHVGTIMWDGNDRSGKPCSEGVYFYRIIGKLYDGTEVEKHGNVTLVR